MSYVTITASAFIQPSLDSAQVKVLYTTGCFYGNSIYIF